MRTRAFLQHACQSATQHACLQVPHASRNNICAHLIAKLRVEQSISTYACPPIEVSFMYFPLYRSSMSRCVSLALACAAACRLVTTLAMILQRQTACACQHKHACCMCFSRTDKTFYVSSMLYVSC